MTFDEWWKSQGRPPKEQLQFEALETYEIANDAWIAATWGARDPVPVVLSRDIPNDDSLKGPVDTVPAVLKAFLR